MSLAYQPSRSLPAKISRRITPFLARRTLEFKLDRPLVSFTFDDCPVSAIENGVKPLADKGWHSTIYVSGSLLGTHNHHGQQIDQKDVVNLHEAGHEIGGHTFSHIDAQSLPAREFFADIKRNQDKLAELDLPASQTFAYPYGQTVPSIKRRLETQFKGLRGIQPGVHNGQVDLNQIKSVPLFAGMRIHNALTLIASLAETPAWVTFFTHDIRDNHSDWGCSPKDMQDIISATEKVGADVLPMDEAIQTLRGARG